MLDPTRMATGVNLYSSEKPEDDIDLTKVVRSILVSSGVSETQLQDAFDKHNFIVESIGKNSVVQRYFLNRYFNTQLMQCVDSKESATVRISLVPGGTQNHWLKLFQENVAPCLVRNNLPKRIQ